MDEKLNLLLEKLDVVEDEKEWLEVLQEAIDYAPHHPQVLYIRALQSESSYETLEHLDHALSHLSHDLQDKGAFNIDSLADFGTDEESELYLFVLMARMMTFLDVNYDYQAFGDYQELSHLDSAGMLGIEPFGMRIALRMNNASFAQSIHEGLDAYDLDVDFLFAIILHKSGLEDEAVALLRPYLLSTPYFKEVVTRVVRGEEFDDELAYEAQEFLATLVEGLKYIEHGLLENLIEEFH